MTSANRPATVALIILIGFMLGATALAQVDRGVRTDDPFALTPVDQGIADLGELNTSNRLIPIDLRQPLDFVRLYQATDGSGRLMRVSGGLSAVFPRSEYAASAGFVFPVIPAGTEFFIGPMSVTQSTYTPPQASFGSFLDSRRDLIADGMTSNLLDGANLTPMMRIHATRGQRRIHHGMTLQQLLTGQPGVESITVDSPERPSGPTVWSSERYRQSRVAALLARALEHRLGS